MKKIKLLLVEDNLHDARFFYEYIKNYFAEEFEITHSQSLRDCIHNLAANGYDVVITDLNLADSSGLNTFFEIKKFTENVPVIILSGVDDKDITLEAIRCGAQDYITKGNYEEDFIYRVILFSIERKKLNAELEENRALLQQQADKLIELNNNLLDMNVNKDRFYSILAHDLLNPFNSLYGSSGMLAESYDELTEDERRTLTFNINNQVKRILKLLKNLLQWTALTTGRIDFRPELININNLLHELIEFQQLPAANKNITLKYIKTPELNINADKFMLETIFRNLLSNAIKFTNTGGLITVRTLIQNDKAVIELEDNGIGMTEDELINLFNFGEKKSKEGTNLEPGTGLGLILCKDLILKNNGNIEVQSEFNKGTKFVVTFPAV